MCVRVVHDGGPVSMHFSISYTFGNVRETASIIIAISEYIVL